VRCIAEPAEASRTPGPEPLPSLRPLRGFRPADVPYISTIVSEALHEHYDPGLYGSLSAEWPAGFLVATDERDVPVGFLLGVSQVPGEGRVLMFAVDHGWRGTGVGHALMDAFLERCRHRQFRRVTLEVRVSNVGAIRFYARYNYSVIDLLRSYYSDGENGYHMARDL
jgi:[ribosomal protein S18]-alanine N-acetyltransferase